MLKVTCFFRLPIPTEETWITEPMPASETSWTLIPTFTIELSVSWDTNIIICSQCDIILFNVCSSNSKKLSFRGWSVTRTPTHYYCFVFVCFDNIMYNLNWFHSFDFDIFQKSEGEVISNININFRSFLYLSERNNTLILNIFFHTFYRVVYPSIRV